MSEMRDPSAETGLTPKASTSLQIGSPIIIIEAPKMLKTAASVPCLRVNSGLVKAGDVGRYAFFLSHTHFLDSKTFFLKKIIFCSKKNDFLMKRL